MGKPITVTSVDQIVNKDMRVADLDTQPEHILRWFSNNILRRMLGYLVGWTGIEFKLLKCDNDGHLETAAVSTANTTADVHRATCGDSYSTYIMTDAKATSFMISIWDKSVYFMWTFDGTKWSDIVEFSADMVYDIPAKMFSFKIKNKDAGQNARFELVGYQAI